MSDKNILEGLVYIDRKFRTEAEFKEMEEKARKENHGVFVPTHPLRQYGTVVGYLSIASPNYPVVFAWLGECIQARESFKIINSVENHVALGGAGGVCFPVPKHSPFHPLMVPMGYKHGGEYDFFYKHL